MCNADCRSLIRAAMRALIVKQLNDDETGHRREVF